MFAGHALFGAFKNADWTGAPIPYADALEAVRHALRR
jgi:hypothetical protein